MIEFKNFLGSSKMIAESFRESFKELSKFEELAERTFQSRIDTWNRF